MVSRSVSRGACIVVCCALMDCVLAFVPAALPLLRNNRPSPSSASQIACNLRPQAGNTIDRRSALLGSASIALAWFAGSSPAQAAATTAQIPLWDIEGGVEMPILALNTAGLTREGTERAVRLARTAGITHVDFHPGVERDGVALAIRSTGRAGLFLTTKIDKAPEGTTPTAAADMARAQIDEDLHALGVDSVDMLMLRDSPDSAVIQAQWAVLEEARTAGNPQPSTKKKKTIRF